MRIERRRTTATELYIQGLSQGQIAEQLGVDRMTIWADLKKVREEWLRDRIFGMNMLKQRELEIIDRVADEAWMAWKKSLQPAVSLKEDVVTGNDDEPALVTAAERTTKGQCGNPAFLETIRQCSADRRKILGLDAPTKVAPTTPDGDEAFAMSIKDLEGQAGKLTDEQLRAVALTRSIFDPKTTSLN